MLVKVQFGPPDVVDRKTGFVFHTVQPNITECIWLVYALLGLVGTSPLLLRR